VSWRYRYAWMSARRRAAAAMSTARLADHLIEERRRLIGLLRAARARADQAETKLHLATVGRAEDLDRLIAAGQTIRELEAALALAVKGNPS
jgi:hypothetical protein